MTAAMRGNAGLQLRRPKWRERPTADLGDQRGEGPV